MSPHLPFITGKEVAKAAERIGFRFDRQAGSHAVYVRANDKRRVVIPIHAGKDLKPKTLAAIIKDMDLTIDEFVDLLASRRNK